MTHSLRSVLPALFVAACARDLPLPAHPGESVTLRVASFVPTHAFSGDTVTVTLTRPPADPSRVQFSIGDGTWTDGKPLLDGRFTFEVPDTTSTGPVWTRSEGVDTAGDDAFTFDGPGRIIDGALRSFTRVPRLYTHVVGSRTEATFGAVGAGLFELSRFGLLTTFVDIKGIVPTAASEAEDEERVVLVGEAADGPCKGTDEQPGYGWVILKPFDIPLDDTPFSPPILAEGCLPRPISAVIPEVVLSPDGAWAVVTYASELTGASAPKDEAYLLEVATGKTTLISKAARIWPPCWAPALGFLVPEDRDVRRVDPTKAQGEWTLTKDVVLGEDNWVTAIAVRADGIMLVGSYQGRILVYDAATWPPTFIDAMSVELTTPGAADLPFTGIAAGLRGRLFALSQPGLGRVLFVAVDADGVAELVGVRSVANAAGVRAMSDGTFRVAAKGAVVTFSQSTGGLLGSVPMPRALSSPQVHRDLCGEKGAEVVEFVEHSRGVGYALDAASLTEGCAVGLGSDPAVTLGNPRELVVSPDAALAAVATATTLVCRSTALGARESKTPLARGEPPNWLARRLALAPDGHTLVASDFVAMHVTVVDLSAPWTVASLPFLDGASFKLVGADADGLGHVALAGDHSVRAFELAAAQTGVATPAGPVAQLPPDEWALAIFGYRAGFFVVTTDERNVYARPFSATSGLGERIGLGNASNIEQVALTPTGRQLLVLVHDPDGQQRLVGANLEAPRDFLEADFVADLGSTASGSFTEFAVSPDGGRAFVLDVDGDGVGIVR